MTGVEYPVVTVGGKEYTVRFSMLAEHLLSINGVSLDQLLPKGHAGRIAQRMQLWACAIAAESAEPTKSPNAFNWAKVITRGEWPAIDAAMEEALKKALAESQTGDQTQAPLTDSLAS